MINKCKVLMTSRGYIREGSPHEEGDEKKRDLEQKNMVRTIAFEQGQRYIPHVSLDRISNGHEGDFSHFQLLYGPTLTSMHFVRAYFCNPLSINSLFRAPWAKTLYLLGLDPKL